MLIYTSYLNNCIAAFGAHPLTPRRERNSAGCATLKSFEFNSDSFPCEQRLQIEDDLDTVGEAVDTAQGHRADPGDWMAVNSYLQTIGATGLQDHAGHVGNAVKPTGRQHILKGNRVIGIDHPYPGISDCRDDDAWWAGRHWLRGKEMTVPIRENVSALQLRAANAHPPAWRSEVLWLA
jgi:hypothetical protein